MVVDVVYLLLNVFVVPGNVVYLLVNVAVVVGNVVLVTQCSYCGW